MLWERYFCKANSTLQESPFTKCPSKDFQSDFGPAAFPLIQQSSRHLKRDCSQKRVIPTQKRVNPTQNRVNSLQFLIFAYFRRQVKNFGMTLGYFAHFEFLTTRRLVKEGVSYPYGDPSLRAPIERKGSLPQKPSLHEGPLSPSHTWLFKLYKLCVE